MEWTDIELLHIPDAEPTTIQNMEKDFPTFLLRLSDELLDDQKSADTRTLAGTVLKKSLDDKEYASKSHHLVPKWVAIDNSSKSKIKKSVVLTLRSSIRNASHTAAQVVAKIASIEIPRKEWPELVQLLLDNMRADAASSLKRATLETLGFLCEVISHGNFEDNQVNHILEVVVQEMKPDNEVDIRLAATRALYNCLGFGGTHFEDELKRDKIMMAIYLAASAEEIEIKQAAFECLVSISSTYYHDLGGHMSKIVKLTSKAVEGVEVVALQAVMFWSSICDKELEIQNSSAKHFEFMEKALHAIVPLLLNLLSKQENLAIAGGTCLCLVARTVGNNILPLVIPFVDSNIQMGGCNSLKAAAIHALGAILEGPSFKKISSEVTGVLNILLDAMGDYDEHVRDTTAWTLSRIFELLHSPVTHSSVITESNLERIVIVLLNRLEDAPRMSEKVCGAIYFLALGYKDAGLSSSNLTLYLQLILSKLVKTTERNGDSCSELRSSAFKALNEVVRCSVLHDASATISILLRVIKSKLQNTLDSMFLYESSRYREGKRETVASLCGVLQVIIQKLGGDYETQVADEIMRLFIRAFEWLNSTRQMIPIFICFGDVALSINEHFGNHSHFNHVIGRVLQVYNELCSDNKKMIKYRNQLMCSILKVLSGIFRGLKNSRTEQTLPHATRLFGFLKFVANNKNRDENVTGGAMLVLAHMADVLGKNMAPILGENVNVVQKRFMDLLNDLQLDDEQLNGIAPWTEDRIKRAFERVEDALPSTEDLPLYAEETDVKKVYWWRVVFPSRHVRKLYQRKGRKGQEHVQHVRVRPSDCEYFGKVKERILFRRRPKNK